MANFFSAELERGRVARPPYAPYLVADSLAAAPWLPSDETHARALDKWQSAQRTFRRHTGNQDLPIGQYALYRLRFIIAGDLTDAWAEFGGITAQLNHLAVVLGLPITDHAGIAVTYDFRLRRAAQKLAKNWPPRTDYFEFLTSVDKDIRADELRGSEARPGELKKEKQKEKAVKEKETKTTDNAQGKKKGEGRWKRKWAPEDWAEWNAKRPRPTPGAAAEAVSTEDAKKKKNATKDSR